MKILLDKMRLDETKFKRLLASLVARNLSGLSEPCYRPDLKKHYYDFLKVSNLTEKDIREFVKRKWQGRKEAKFLLHNDAISNFIIFLMQYFLNKRDQITYRNLMLYFMIRQYANLFAKSFKYCLNDSFKYALEILSKTHLFSREKTISNALYFLSQAMLKRYTKSIKEDNLDQVSLFIQVSRSRINQSMKSFVSTYRDVVEEGPKIRSDIEPSEEDETGFKTQVEEKGVKAIDNIVRKITVYKIVDMKAKEEARKISKINTTLADLITKGLNDTKYIDSIKIVLKLFVKSLNDVDTLCGKKYYTNIRRLMSLKRTVSKFYFKQQVSLLLVEVLKDKKFMSKYNNLTSQTQFLINLFLAYYLTMVFRNTIC